MRFLLACSICFISFICFCQNGTSVNELKALNAKDSIVMVGIKTKFAQHINPNPDSALFYINKIRTFSIEKEYPIGLAEADYAHANYFRRTQKLDSAVVYFSKSLQKSEEINYKKGRALGNNGLCRIYYFLGKNKEATDACQACLDVFENDNLIEKPDPFAAQTITDTYTAFGNIYARQNNLKAAINYYLKADSLHSIFPQRPDIIAASYQSLGSIFKSLKDYEKSEAYFLKANSEFVKLPVNVDFYLSTTAIELAGVYFFQDELAKADSLATSSYEYFQSINEGILVNQSRLLLGLIRLKQGDMKEAETFLKSGFDSNVSTKFNDETAKAAIELGRLFLNKKEPKKAIEYLNLVANDDKQHENSALIQEALLLLSDAYRMNGDFKKSTILLRSAYELKDSLNEVQSIAQVQEIESIYNTEKQEKEIVLLKSQNDLANQLRINQRNILLAILGLTALVGLFFFYLYRNRQKTNYKLQELDRAKSNFFTNVTHEFRTPLTLIQGPIQNQLKRTNITEVDRQHFEMIQRNSNRLLTLVDQMFNISKLETGQLKLNISNKPILPFVSTLADSFNFAIQQKEITYKLDVIPSEAESWFDQDALEKIVVNLFSNALKYTPSKGTILAKAELSKDHFYLEVKNTGKGLKPEEQEKLFDRFYQVDNHQQGIGVGLALVKELVELHKGNIKVESRPNEWTSFNLKIPVQKSAFSKSDFSENGVSDSESIKTNPEVFEVSKVVAQPIIEDPFTSDKPILLVVDDNEDVRSFVSSIFRGEYRIYQAENGEEGIQLAMEHIPDIIVSDVMMPVKNGIELCNTLKGDEKTSHIPIVLLTAKAGEEHEIEGIETGADIYITKPFNQELLQLHVRNLIETRKKLQQKYTKGVVLQPKEIAVTSLDEQFLERLQAVLDKNVESPAFNVEVFSKAMGMSRMQLHRKLKALIGLSATEFIRSQRLMLAAQLLEKSDINISEIGYSVGFNDHAYFSKCFKEFYHCTPTEYSRRKA